MRTATQRDAAPPQIASIALAAPVANGEGLTQINAKKEERADEPAQRNAGKRSDFAPMDANTAKA